VIELRQRMHHIIMSRSVSGMCTSHHISSAGHTTMFRAKIMSTICVHSVKLCTLIQLHHSFIVNSDQEHTFLSVQLTLIKWTR